MLMSISNRNQPTIIGLRGDPQKTPGNTRCFYHYFWKQK
jgi:hypothetical protein